MSKYILGPLCTCLFNAKTLPSKQIAQKESSVDTIFYWTEIILNHSINQVYCSCLIGLFAHLAAVGFVSVMNVHVFLQIGFAVEDLAALGTLVQLFRMHLLDVLSELVQRRETHPAFLAVMRFCNV